MSQQQPLPPPSGRQEDMLTCSVLDCDRRSRNSGFCNMHYQRVRTHGDPGQVAPYERPKAKMKKCVVDGCDTKAKTKRHGLCSMHHSRWYKHGDVGDPGRIRAEPGAEWTTEQGYVILQHNGRKTLKHRMVMAEYLERELHPWETVHHIDGNRSNNVIENLQLRIGAHGPGQKYVCSDCGSRRIEPVEL